jgi:hypothetical protein
MFGMFQRRDQRSQANSRDYLVSLIQLNRGRSGLSAREKLAVARRVEMSSPLDNPLSALDAPLSTLDLSVPISQDAPAATAPAYVSPVSAPAFQPSAEQAAQAAGGAAW